MTPAPLIRVGQTWERKGTGRRVRVAAIYPDPPLVELHPLGHGRRSGCKPATLRRDFRIIAAPPVPIGDWP